MNKYLIIAIVVLAGVTIAERYQLIKVTEEWELAESNVKAYSNQLSISCKDNMALRLSVDQLKYFNDSVLKALDATRKELKIKDKNLKALQAISSKFAKKDTIRIPGDTIFKDPELKIDTLMGDKWYTLRLGLEYPSMVVVEPEFKSEKHIVVSTKKETVNPPKKFFLLRWLQRKHTVVNIDVKEMNPYVNDESTRYVEIVK